MNQNIFSKMTEQNRYTETMSGNEISNLSNMAHRCIYCTTTEKLQTFDGLEPGDHIRLANNAFKKFFNIFDFERLKSLLDPHMSLFYHHAIVTDIEKLSSMSAILHIVSFRGSSFDARVVIREHIVNVNLTYDEINVIRYGTGASPRNEIIERARGFLNESGDVRYNLVSNNSEHFAHFCCTGVKRSNQIQEVKHSIQDMMKGPLQRIIRLVMRFARVTIDDIVRVPVKKIFLGQYQISAIVVIVYLALCIYRQRELTKDLKSHKICRQCFMERTKDMWLRFGICFASQAGVATILALVISTGLCGGVVLGVTALLFIMSVAIMLVIPALRKRLMSPFSGRRVRIEILTQELRGNVISFKKFGQMHDGIVTKIEIYPDTDETKGKVSVIHYSSATQFGQRMIVEEDIDVDLTEAIYKKHDYVGYRVYPPDIVIQRARQRIGETKYGIFSNRSCHFCHWAMVKEDVIDYKNSYAIGRRNVIHSINPRQSVSSYLQLHIDHSQKRVLSTSTITEREAWIRDEVKGGAVVRLRINGQLHYGITTEVTYDINCPSMLIAYVIYRGRRKMLTEDIVEVDLRREHVWIYTYPLSHRYSPEEIVARAKQKVAKQGIGLRDRSYKVMTNISKKVRDTPIEAFTELSPGDIIIFYCLSKRHAAVVSDITEINSDSKEANVSIIHYSSNGLLRANTVKEETVIMNLRSMEVLARSYEGFVTYPNKQVVERARLCLGEQKYSRFGNTSWNLVHWSKVVNKPSIVTPLGDYVDDNQNTCVNTEDVKIGFVSAGNMKTGNSLTENLGNADMDKTKKQIEFTDYLLLPETGEIFGYFRRQLIRRWRDFKPGTIVEFKQSVRKRLAILSDSDEEAGTITTIYYKNRGMHDVIVEETMQLNLKRDHIWMYVSDPTKVNKPDIILENARRYCSQKKFALRSGSWDFCKKCVLKNEYLHDG